MIASVKSCLLRLRMAYLALVGMLLAACDPGAITSVGSGASAPTLDPNAPVAVALLVPRGGTPNDDLLAQNLENAARLAISNLDGVNVDLRVYGTAGTAANASTAASQAVADGASIILGPVYGEAANAAGVAASSSGVNVLSFSNNPTIAGGNVFILGPTFRNTANRLVGYATRQGRDQIVVVHAEDVAGQLGRNAITLAMSGRGARLAGTVGYALSQEGVAAAVPQIKAAIDGNGANALFLTANSASALPLFSQLLPEAGINPATTQYIGLTRWDIPAQTLALPGVQGGWFALPDPAATSAFRARYAAAYGGEPHPLAGLAFDGIAAVGALVQSQGADALSASSITQAAGFRGASGIFRLLRDGTNERGLAVATVRSNSIAILEPAPQAFGGAGF